MSIQKDEIFIFDFGCHQSGSMVRFLRELGISCELFPAEKAVEVLSSRIPGGVIFSGGSESVEDVDSIPIDRKIIDICETNNVPILALAYAMYAICYTLGGKVNRIRMHQSEYKRERLFIESGLDSALEGEITEFIAYGCHLDTIDTLPPGFKISIKDTHGTPGGIINIKNNIRGFCFHPQEVEQGKADTVMKKFCLEVCRCEKTWNMIKYHERVQKEVQEQCGDNMFVVAGLSGGVDSTVCAAIVHGVIKERFHGIMINTGLMRYK